MRARVNTPLDYEGPWSEWSEEFTWKTENGTAHGGYLCKVLWTVNASSASIEKYILSAGVMSSHELVGVTSQCSCPVCTLAVQQQC